MIARTPLTPPRARLARLCTVLLASALAACASGGARTDGGAQTAAVTGAGPRATPLDLAPQLDTLNAPFEITSVGGVLDVTLAAVFQNLDVPGQGKFNLRTYQVLKANGVDYTDSAKYGFPGPTLRAFRGDSIHIVLVNNMFPVGSNSTCLPYQASADSVDVMQDCFHGANWTNIHYHGMHVTPDSVGDDVLLMIPPGKSHEYGFRIPWNQSPGTHWYHPHKHGSVAIQVMNGMTGALLVDGGGLDSLADQHGMRERVIAFQQIMPSPNLITGDGAPQVTLANGQLRPVIRMAPGEVQRWRLVDENFNKTSGFKISFADTTGTEPTLYDVARDGVAYADTNYAPGGTPVPDTSVIMAPGNRLDVFVQAPANEGLFRLDIDLIQHDRPNDVTRTQRLRDNQNPRTGAVAELAAAAGTAQDTNFVFFVQVDASIPYNGSTLPASLPALPSFLANLPGPLRPDSINPNDLPTIVFADSGFGAQSPTNPTRFFLGTARNPWMKFNSEVVYTPESPSGQPMPMILDSVQTWLVANQSLATNHPFHIHINPFQVISVFAPNPTDPNAALYAELNAAAQARRSPVWLDVLALPLPRVDTLRTSAGAIVRIDTIPGFAITRQKYAPFLNADGSTCTNCGPAWGEFVMHCHILGHEERGMMQAIQIIPFAGWAGQRRAGAHGAHGASPRSTAPAAPPAQPHRH
jgi:FtsP/CotA-like multicopper oxidase with cupredoxin domain